MKFRIIVIAIWMLIIVPTMTYGLFIDTEISTGNTFSATTLDTEINPEFTPPIIRKITYEEDFTFSFKLNNNGKLDTINNLSLSKIDNEKFAPLITVIVELDSVGIIYKGPLDKLEINEYLVQTAGQGNAISLTFSITKEDYFNTPEESVKILIQNHAWQSTLPYGSGFFDNEYIDVALINPLIILPIIPIGSVADITPYNPLTILEETIENV